MKLLVCGGRDFSDMKLVNETLNELHGRKKITLLIHGAARGADSLADRWAFRAEIPRKEFRADWSMHGRAAGPLRNQKMIDEGKPEMVLAFSGGRGTADMIRRAKAANIPVIEVGLCA